MIEIPPGTDSLDLDGDDVAEEHPANVVEATDEASPDRPFMYGDAEQWLHGYALPRESWEQMRWDGPQQILVFYRDYFYPLMDRLTALDGPFHAYDTTTHTELPDTFPVWDAPAGYFRQGKDTE